MLYVFISPRKLTEKETQSLDKIRDTDPRYVAGVNNGWSVLVTGQKIDNTIIRPGKMKRGILCHVYPKNFWKRTKNLLSNSLMGQFWSVPPEPRNTS